jgi:hypothetical protein
MKKTLTLILLFAAATFGQMPTMLTGLADPSTVCGSPDNERPEIKTFTGRVAKREFAENKIWINGVALAGDGDVRSFINFDDDYIANIGHMVPDDLSHMLTVGTPVKIWAYECRMEYVAYRVKRLKP